MASEIRVDTSKNASGLCTVTYSNTGAVLSGITTGTFSGDITGDITGNVTGNMSGGSVSATTGAFSSDVILTQDPQGFVDDSAQPQASFLIKHGTSGSNRRWVGIGASLTGAWLQSSSPGGSGLAAPFWINKGGGEVRFGTYGTKLFIKNTSAATVGIGTDDPDASLEIYKGSAGTYLKAGGDNANNARSLTFTSSATSNSVDGGKHTINATSGHGELALATAGSERMIITSSGAVAIGTDAPSYSGGDMQHEIKKNNNRTYTAPLMVAHSHLLLNNSDTTTNAFCGLGIRAGTGDGAIGFVYNGSANSSDFVISTDGGNNGTERLRITNAGIIQCGSSGVLKAEINNAVSGHQFISQCSDNQDGFEIYQQHGSTATRNTLAVYDNRGNSNAKQLAFAVVGNGNVSVPNGNLVMGNTYGIDFSATGDGNGTDSSELLDDYEEGTWSPTIYGGTTAGSYSYQANRTGGKYTKIGNLVYIEGVLRIETINSAGAGDLYMGGMPYSTSGPMASAWTIGKGVQFFMYGTSGNTTADDSPPPFTGTASGGASAFNIRSYGKNLNVMPQIEDMDNQWWIFQVAGWYPVS